ncbi:hypothetical protein AEP_00647 [Curvibacter sp. AEP1-3]|uniref:hypothetical protein n=1 Tax=Curvibacter sp. AEP1-3 TaxID=1844971 RepID=UPI000B567750|nr:hypothetical protein [Curvibacter sp. AEP1-3]ARV17607.1 hypothetical protein AEP_00647 [Curvibacter sp. AEP1-3]
MIFLPILVGLVVDAQVDLGATRSTEALHTLLLQLQHYVPHSRSILVSLCANEKEQELVDAMRALGVEVESVAGDTAGQGLAWLCSHCSVIFALSSNSGEGRAKLALDFRIHSIPPELGGNRGVFFAPETGPVVLMEEGELPKECQLSDLLIFPHGQSLSRWQHQLQELDKANAAAQRLGTYCDPKSIVDIPEDLMEERLVTAFRVVDTLSRKRQAHVTWSHGIMLCLGFAGLLVMQCMGMWIPGLPMADVYAVGFMMLGAGHMWIRQLEATDQYADYRVLAECLRVQYFWRKAGVAAAPADFFMHKHMRRLSWVREAIKAFHLPVSRANQFTQASAAPWLIGQLEYHTDSAVRNGRLHRCLKRAVVSMYGISGAFTIWMFALPADQYVDMWRGFALGMSASCGTLLLIFNGSMGFGSRAAQHERMQESFASAIHLLSNVDHEHERRELLVDLGRETIQETSEWIYVQGPP